MKNIHPAGWNQRGVLQWFYASWQ